MTGAETIQSGLHRLVGVRCRCGGDVYVAKVPSHDPAFRWECYCARCKTCDCNGWPTLAACVREAPKFWRG
jgi:hypothetical protein